MNTISGPTRSSRPWIVAAIVVALGVLIWYFGPTTLPAEGEHAEFWSLVPAILTLALVFLTRDVIISLLLGIIAAGLVSGQLNVLDAYILPAVGTRSYALILVVYLWALGGLIGIWTRTYSFQSAMDRSGDSCRTWSFDLVLRSDDAPC